ncbi:MAG: zinc-binding dehydrogenase [Bacteroidetes bacterium]|nr:MAG: zinc-binding dehydrogenase [Bacteroidota bacterium]
MIRRTYRMDPGSIANLRIREEELEDPKAGEVQVAVKAIGLNFADLFTVWGMYKAAPSKDFIPGLEYSGVVSKVGPGANYLREGDRVMGITRFGAYVDTLNIDARYVVKLREKWSFTDGASFLVQALTAYYGMVDLGRLQKGETVLIHSAAGGVGLQANRIAKRFDAYTIGSIGSSHKIDTLKSEGFDDWIVRSKNFAHDLRNTLGDRRLDIVMECIGGSVLMDGIKQLGVQGRMIVYGSASFTTPGDRPNKLKMMMRYLRRPKIDPLLLPNSNKSVIGFNLIWLYAQIEKFEEILNALEEMQLPAPIIGERYTFDKLPDAIRKLQSGMTIGKVVVELQEPLTS